VRDEMEEPCCANMKEKTRLTKPVSGNLIGREVIYQT
jgi:hypothetical protein